MITHLYPPPEATMKAAYVSGMAAYNALCAEAEADYEGYWARLAREFVVWKTPFTRVLDSSNAPFFKWFEDGTLNVSYNCLDRQVEAGLGDKVAITFVTLPSSASKMIATLSPRQPPRSCRGSCTRRSACRPRTT